MERGAKILALLTNPVRIVLASTGVPEDRGSAAVSEEPEVMESAPAPATRPNRMRMWTGPMLRELEAPMEMEVKEALGLKTPQWKSLKPINKGLIRPG